MISLKNIITFYPISLQKHKRFILKEYLQYKILDFIYRSIYKDRLVFLGGTCLRIVHNNHRFSEDIDFDNFDLSEKEFEAISDLVEHSLKKEGYKVETKRVMKSAFHCYIKFPAILYENDLSGHLQEKILISLDTEPQPFDFKPDVSFINKFGIFLPIKTTPLDLLFSQKAFAILNRKRNKGRDFFDLLFLISKGVKPNYDYLNQKAGIANAKHLKRALVEHCLGINMIDQVKDVRPFLFDPEQAERIAHFAEYITTCSF